MHEDGKLSEGCALIGAFKYVVDKRFDSCAGDWHAVVCSLRFHQRRRLPRLCLFVLM